MAIYSLLTAAAILLAILFYRLNRKVKTHQQQIESQNNEIAGLEEELDNKLTKARRIHQRLLPDNIPQPEDLFINTYYRPAEYTGGDYYNVFQIDHGAMSSLLNQYLIYYFDVSGHGIDSTLLSIFVNDAIESYFRLRHNPGEKVSTAELMNFIDHRYQEEGFPDDYLVCLFLGRLDLNNYTLSYTTGGLHFPVFRISPQKNTEEIPTGGLPISTGLGLQKDVRPLKQITLEKNDTLLLTTDGLLEQHREGEMYYDDRLEKVLNDCRNLPAPFLREALRQDFDDFNRGEPTDDDITYLALGRPGGKMQSWQLGGDDKLKEKASEIVAFIDKGFGLKDGAELQKLLTELTGSQKSLNEHSAGIRAFKNDDYTLLELEDKAGSIENWKKLLNRDNFTAFDIQRENFKPRKGRTNITYDDFYRRLYFLQYRD
ncbi:PP2C family protein-serine/threonine phosphatase [Halarsenatibacter silvermanii]|uniref:PP2C family protein-serine/threonine phosphatase n=1 Tax=Halarsenatibacter silvermanii TaxID=321763 RepID=UPI000B7FCD7F|nr:SpoIIE family protein phosphatase [Halarsenatibacter silvermanii]